MASSSSPSSSHSTASSHSPTVAIIAIDASKQSADTFQYYFDHIYKKEHSVILLHVIELPDMSHARQANLTPSALYELWTEENAKSKELETGYLKILANNGIKDAVFRTSNGLKPGEVIVGVATEEKASMIVMGTRGMGLIRRTILGSASDYVVHHAPCSVVVCRCPEDHAKHHQEHRASEQGLIVNASMPAC